MKSTLFLAFFDLDLDLGSRSPSRDRKVTAREVHLCHRVRVKVTFDDPKRHLKHLDLGDKMTLTSTPRSGGGQYVAPGVP